jgi:hypothetical protein
MINGIQCHLPAELRVYDKVVVPDSVSRTVKGFVNCDAPLDKTQKLEVGWEKYVSFLLVLDLTCQINRVMLLKTAMGIAQGLRVTEHCPEHHFPNGDSDATGVVEYQGLVFFPSFANPTTVVFDPMLQKLIGWGWGSRRLLGQLQTQGVTSRNNCEIGW